MFDYQVLWLPDVCKSSKCNYQVSAGLSCQHFSNAKHPVDLSGVWQILLPTHGSNFIMFIMATAPDKEKMALDKMKLY